MERIDPVTESATHKKLTRSSRYLFFDLGVRRFASQEGSRLGINRLVELFDHFCGLEVRVVHWLCTCKSYYAM